MLRRLRSALTIGLLWGIVWLILGITLGVVTRGWTRSPFAPIDATNLAVWTGLGFVSGTAFAAFLALLERNRTVETLSFGRLVLWGILAGAGIPIVLTEILLYILIPDAWLDPNAYPIFAVLGVAGAATAMGTIALARRATPT